MAVAQTRPISGGKPTSFMTGPKGMAMYLMRSSSWRTLTPIITGTMILERSRHSRATSRINRIRASQKGGLFSEKPAPCMDRISKAFPGVKA